MSDEQVLLDLKSIGLPLTHYALIRVSTGGAIICIWFPEIGIREFGIENGERFAATVAYLRSQNIPEVSSCEELQAHFERLGIA